MKRNLKDYGLLVLKGMGMGAATSCLAYQAGPSPSLSESMKRLIDSIKSINGASLKLLFTGKIAAFWKAINANFCYPSLQGSGSVSSHWQKSLPGC